MAIQMRRGANKDFDPEKMLPAELAITTDGTRKVYAAFAPGDYKELASKEEVQNIVDNFTGSVDKKIEEAVKQVTDEAQEQIDSIAAKGQEVLDSIPADYQDAVEQVEKNKLAIFDLDRYKASAIIQKAKGRSIVINDSAKAAFPGMRTFGKSEQVKTTGAQLFDASKLATFSQGGATVTNNGDGSFTISGSDTLTLTPHIYHAYTSEETLKFIKAGTLRVNFGATTYPYCFISFIDSSGNKIKEISNANVVSGYYNITGDILLTDGIYMNIGFYGATGKTITPGTIKPMLYFDGDSDGTWEPYTGNMPAPNPQYPQPIVNAGQKLAEGWQLFDIDNAAHAYVQSDGIVAANTTNLISDYINVKDMNVTISTNALIKHIDYACYGSEKTFIKTVSAHDVKAINIYKDSAVCYIRAWFNIDGSEIGNRLHAYEPMINYGTTAKPWEPYTGGVKAAFDVGIETEVFGGNLINPDEIFASLSTKTYITQSLSNGVLTLTGTPPSTYYQIGSSYMETPESWRGKKLYFGGTVSGDQPNVVLYFRNSAQSINGSYGLTKTGIVEVNVPEDAVYYEFVFCLNRTTTGTAYTAKYGDLFLSLTDEIGYTKHVELQSLPINTPNGLAGIEVTDASELKANYIDADGKMWVCDTREWERGVDVKRVLYDRVKSSLNWRYSAATSRFYAGDTRYVGALKDSAECFCTGTYFNTHFKNYIAKNVGEDLPDMSISYINGVSNGYAYKYLALGDDVDAWKAFLDANEVYTLGILATPIETPIPEEEMAAWRAMHSNEPTTTILSDADVEVDYVTDTKTYIDNQIAAIAAAAVSAMLAGSEV